MCACGAVRQSVPSATQRRNMERCPAYHCIKSARFIKYTTSGCAFQSKNLNGLRTSGSASTKIKMCLENLHLVFVISAILLYIKKNLNQANKLSTGATYGGRGVELSSELFMLKGATNT